MSITILIADDHAIVRDGLRMVLQAQPDMQVVGEAADGLAAVREAAAVRPDVAILDMAMPELNGLEAARRIGEQCPQTRIIMLSMHGTSEHILQALQTGVRGYLLKASAGAEVIKAIRAVHAGERYLSEKVLDRVVESSVALQQQVGDDLKGPLARLSSREREILQRVVEGKTSAEIAELLYLSPKTVETYRSNLMKKLDIQTIPDLVKFAIKHGLTALE